MTARKKVARKAAKKNPITRLQKQFVAKMIKTGNGTQSYMEVYGCSRRAAGANAARLLADDRIAALVADGEAKVLEKAEVTAAQVLDKLWQRANADPRELVEYRRTCCRHCWGVGFGYQLSQAEKVRIQEGPQKDFYSPADEEGEEWKAKRKKARAQRFEIGDVLRDTPFGAIVFGGIGWDPRKEPNGQCPECFGKGLQSVHIHDTRTLSPSAASIYLGVQKTRDGVKVNLMNPMDALIKVGESLTMFKQSITHSADAELQAAIAAGDKEALKRIAEGRK